MYVVTYKIFTGVAIYLIFVSSVKIRTHPLIHKDVGKVTMENTLFAGIDVCPSHLFPQSLLIEVDQLYADAKITGTATDSFGTKWSVEQAAKLYYYVYKRCQAATNHSRFNGFFRSLQSLQKDTAFEYPKQFTLRDNPEDKDFQQILSLVKKHEGTVDCSKILKACRWGPHGIRKCTEIFKIEQTEDGICCRLQRIPKSDASDVPTTPNETGSRWNIDEHSFTGKILTSANDSPSFQKVPGSEHGLTFVLTMDTKNMACPINEGAAYMVYVHSPLDNSNAKTNGIPIAPNHEVYINVNADVTLVDKDIYNLPIESRQCYSQEEGLKLLKSNQDYTENNCRMECRTLLFQNKCQCNPLGTTAGQNETLCGPQHEDCTEKLKAKINTEGYSQMCMNLSTPMNCYHGCTEVIYTTFVTSTPYFGDPAILDELELKEGQYAATVKIFFGLDTFAAKQMQQQYDFWEYVGIVGGLLGMLIGFDFMTLVHLTYAFGIWMKGLWLKRKTSRVARAIFNMTNHVDLVKDLSTQTPITPGSAGPSTGTSCQPPTWPVDMTKLEARLKSIYIIQKGSKNDRIPSDSLTDLDQPADLINPVGMVIPTRKNIRNALFEHMPKTVAFKNIFTIPKRVTPVNQVDHIELLDVEHVEPSDMEITDPNVIEPVSPADLSETAVVDPTEIEHTNPIEIDTIGPTSLEPTIELVDSELIGPTDIQTTEQIEIEHIAPDAMQTICRTNLEPCAPGDPIDPLEPSYTNPGDTPEAKNRIPLYKHKKYLENGQPVIVLNPKKPLCHHAQNISSSEEEL